MTIQWTKPVIQLDSDGLFVDMAEAELDTYAKDGSYIVPGGCIEAAAPSEIPAGHAARWNGSGWEFIPDFRGQTVYDKATGQPFETTRVGALPDGMTTEAPPSAWHTWSEEQSAWILSDQAATEILAQAKAAKLKELNAAAQAFVAAAAEVDSYPDFEIRTWVLQSAEAKAWHADPAADTPVLDQIAASRGVPADALKAAALRKSLAFEKLTAHVAGQRQALETKIEKAKNQTALETIEIAFSAL
ncbi:hypothetical protein [Bergeriella denitrificans]|uniref:Putative phage fiber-spike protein n=1 Tax=Bergeriella denitrificans TaxID=494 RepID=A0A378UG31_BERDE|nr:hypothetical protein [Bergeriella denitrificans]STZ76348.1 putative phage fiber-spike protein [Bergeriella denitrificans]